MSGYAGNSDLESEHALILAENGIHASQMALHGVALTNCIDCGGTINPLRVAAAKKLGHMCIRCLGCQEEFELLPQPKIKMLTRML